MGEEVFFGWGVEVRLRGCAHLPRVDVHAELPLLWERQREDYHVIVHSVTDVLVEPLLFVPVAVKSGHEIS